MNIWAVCKDPGGTNGILPVVPKLKDLGHDVLLIANGKAVELLDNKKDGFVVCNSAEQALKNFSLPDALVTSMCSYGGVGRDLVPLLRGKCPIIALQDYWGAGLVNSGEAAWGDICFRPDYLIVNDKIGKNIVLNVWPDFHPDKVLILGYPALDKYVTIDADVVAKQARITLGLKDKKRPLIFFAGQDLFIDVLADVVKVLNRLDKDFYFLPRPYPRMKANFPEGLVPWQEAIIQLRSGTLVVDFFNQLDVLSLLAASDLIISTYSTILIEASTLRKPNIAVLYPKIMDRFKKSFSLQEFPPVELGCSMKADSFNSLNNLIQENLDRKFVQKNNFFTDGKSAERVAIFIDKLI